MSVFSFFIIAAVFFFILLSIVAIIIGIVMANKNKSKQPNMQPIQGFQQAPPMQANQAAIQAPPVQANQAASTEGTSISFCPSCGGKLLPESSFCVLCGARIR